MQVQVGMDPVAVIQHVQGVERHAHAAIHEAHSEVTSTQRLADQAVQNIVQEARTHVSEVQAQAQVQVQSVETRAQAIVSDMETNYQKEIVQI
jgi:vacuolar-type H+-ATPase subunit H